MIKETAIAIRDTILKNQKIFGFVHNGLYQEDLEFEGYFCLPDGKEIAISIIPQQSENVHLVYEDFKFDDYTIKRVIEHLLSHLYFDDDFEIWVE